MILTIFNDRQAEIVLVDSAPIPAAMDVVRLLLSRGVVAAKIVRIPGSSGPGSKPLAKPGVSPMRKFVRQKSNNGAVDANIDFGAAAAKVARVFEPSEYRLKVQSARVIQPNGNVSVVLDLVELGSGGRIATSPMWVDGPNAAAGDLAAENKNLIAQLLTLADLPTAGNVSELIPKLAGLEFDARLVLSVDNRRGRSFNAIADIYTDEAP